MSGNYEFSETENKTFQGLVGGMKRSGLIVIVGALILLGYNLVQYLEISITSATGGSGLGAPKWAHYVDYGLWILMSVIGVFIGASLIKATAGFVALINTQGDDINHLMGSVQKLTKILGMVFLAGLSGSILLLVSFGLLLVYS